MQIVKALILLLMLTFMGANAQNKTEHHNLFTQILQDYVKSGLVNYEKLKEDKRLDKYIKQLAETNPDEFENREDKMAFWINAYNAYTLKFIVDEYPVESINDLHWGGLYLGSALGTTVWDDEKVVINGREISLNDIEHNILRKEFKDNRIHFAVVCASLSCPPLRNESFEGFKLEEQLFDQAVKFFNDKTRNRFDMKNRTAYLSKILDWYDDDFGNSEQEILLYVLQYLSKQVADDIRKNIDEWKVAYLSYNWDLNNPKN